MSGHDVQSIIDLMGNAGGEKADARETFRAGQVAAGPADFVLEVRVELSSRCVMGSKSRAEPSSAERGKRAQGTAGGHEKTFRALLSVCRSFLLLGRRQAHAQAYQDPSRTTQFGPEQPGSPKRTGPVQHRCMIPKSATSTSASASSLAPSQAGSNCEIPGPSTHGKNMA